jgi:hypothetical protein
MLPCVFFPSHSHLGLEEKQPNTSQQWHNFSDCRITFIPIQTLEESIECTKCVAGFLVMHFQQTKEPLFYYLFIKPAKFEVLTKTIHDTKVLPNKW